MRADKYLMEIGEIKRNDLALLKRRYETINRWLTDKEMSDPKRVEDPLSVSMLELAEQTHKLVCFNQVFSNFVWDDSSVNEIYQKAAAMKDDVPEAAWMFSQFHDLPSPFTERDFLARLHEVSEHDHSFRGYAEYCLFLLYKQESSLDSACDLDFSLAWSYYQRNSFEEGVDVTDITYSLIEDGDIDAFYVLGRMYCNTDPIESGAEIEVVQARQEAGRMLLLAAAVFGHRPAGRAYFKTLNPESMDYYRWFGHVYSDDAKYANKNCLRELLLNFFIRYDNLGFDDGFIKHPREMNPKHCYELGRSLHENDAGKYNTDEQDNVIACINFFCTQHESYQSAVYTWMLCAPRLGVCHDVSRLIADEIWALRYEPLTEFSSDEESYESEEFD